MPIKTLSVVTDLDAEAISANVGRILLLMPLVIPIWLVVTMVGCARGPCRLAGALWSSAGRSRWAQFLWSNFVGYELVDIISAVASLAAGVVLLRFWKPGGGVAVPARCRRLGCDRNAGGPGLGAEEAAGSCGPGRRFAFLTLAVLFWGTPAVKKWMDAHASWKIEMPRLHLKVAKGEAVTGHKTPEPKDRDPAVLDIVPVSATGTGVFLAAIISGLFLGVSPAGDGRDSGAGQCHRMVPAFAAIFCMLALGFVTKYSGLDTVLGLAFTRTGRLLYPLFGTLLGWVGVALTGSDTSSNVLFGNLQKITARKLKQRDPDGIGQFGGRGHGEDDQCAVDRRGRRRHRRRG